MLALARQNEFLLLQLLIHIDLPSSPTANVAVILAAESLLQLSNRSLLRGCLVVKSTANAVGLIIIPLLQLSPRSHLPSCPATRSKSAMNFIIVIALMHPLKTQ